MPLSKALYHASFICRQRCKWWSRRPKLTSSLISDVKPIIYILHLHFLKVATEMAEQTDSGRLFQRDKTRVKSSCTSIGLDTRDWQTIIIVWSQWTGRNRCGKHGAKINRLFFTQSFVGKQIDLKRYSKPYWQPMKGTKQWKAASKWRRLCHQVGQLILYTAKGHQVCWCLWGRGQVKKMCLEMFLEGSNWNSWLDRHKEPVRC